MVFSLEKNNKWALLFDISFAKKNGKLGIIINFLNYSIENENKNDQ